MSLAVSVLAISLFTVQNSFWVNLHQFLYAEAARQRAGRAATLNVADFLEAEKAAWSDALVAYRDLATHDLVFDGRLVAINDALGRAGDVDRLADAATEPAIVTALNRAASIYRARLWPRHREMNAAWIAEMQPQIDRHAASLTQALAKAYSTPWPASPILIDVSVEAGTVGGYTTNDGPPGFAAHTTMSPVGGAAEGAMGVEIIFHEASHAVDAEIMRHVREECGRQGIPVPRNLWHAIIFYTTGELVRRELGFAADASYLPYAYRFNVWGRGMSWERPALEKDWLPYLDGRVTYDEAMRNLVRDMAR